MSNLKSARSVQTITNVGYHRCDPGLYLQVAKGGTKSWLFRFKSPVTSKQREMGLGSLSIISLAQARNLAFEYRQQLLEGVDPLEEQRTKKQARQLQQARTITFKDASEQCITSKIPEWKSKKHAQQWTNTLTTYAYPVIGNLPLSEIETASSIPSKPHVSWGTSKYSSVGAVNLKPITPSFLISSNLVILSNVPKET